MLYFTSHHQLNFNSSIISYIFQIYNTDMHAASAVHKITQKNSKKANCNLGISKNNSESHKGLSSTNELFKSEPCTVPTTSYQII